MKKKEFVKNLQDELEFDSELNEETRIKDIAEWDSMSALMLMSYVHRTFNVNITAADLEEIDTVKSIIEKIGLDKFEV